MKFDDKYFAKFKFTEEQIKKNLDNALKDFDIAERDVILEVKFNYAYKALIKAGIALLSSYHLKIRSVPGHHIKILEKMAEILNDDAIADIGNAMRSKRNLDFYGGGILVSEKECSEYLRFADEVIKKAKNILMK